MKIVILDGYTENPGDLSWNKLEALGELTVYDRTPLDDESEIIKRIGGAQIVLTNKTPLSSRIFDACPALKYVSVLATGYNVVDVEAAKARGVAVSNIPAYGNNAVGQMAIALLLEITNRVGYHDWTVHQGKWEHHEDWCYWDYPLMELAGKVMGIIGFGRIGQCTGRAAKGLGMDVLAYDVFPNDSGREIAEYVDLDTLFAKSDVIALHCPLLKDNAGLINKNTIQKMKDGVIIINNSRGQLIEEQDLAEALNSGKVYTAGVDVVSTEPIRGDNPLLKAKNCIITPHNSWGAKEPRQRIMDMTVENVTKFMEGSPINVVN